MTNIVEYLKQRISELDIEIDKSNIEFNRMKQTLDSLNNRRDSLRFELEHVQQLKRAPVEAGINDNQPTITDILLKLLTVEGKTVDELKSEVKQAGIDRGINQGRAIHTALVRLSKKGLAGKNDGVWVKNKLEAIKDIK